MMSTLFKTLALSGEDEADIVGLIMMILLLCCCWWRDACDVAVVDCRCLFSWITSSASTFFCNIHHFNEWMNESNQSTIVREWKYLCMFSKYKYISSSVASSGRWATAAATVGAVLRWRQSQGRGSIHLLLLLLSFLCSLAAFSWKRWRWRKRRRTSEGGPVRFMPYRGSRV